MTTALEVLKAAEQRLANPDIPYDFGDCTVCTCGHIYAAAGHTVGGNGLEYRDGFSGESAKGPYREALEAIIEANPHVVGLIPDERTREGRPVAWVVSDMTLFGAGIETDDPVRREHGLTQVRKAIDFLEARYEQDRLNVLAQTERIINDADVREPVEA